MYVPIATYYMYIKMFSYWFQNSDPHVQHITADAIMKVISAPLVDLTEDKVSKSKDTLTSSNFNSSNMQFCL